MSIETRVTIAYFLGVGMALVVALWCTLWEILTRPEYVSTLDKEENIK